MERISELFCTLIFYIVATLWICCTFLDFFVFFFIKLIWWKRLFSMILAVLVNLLLKAFLISTGFFSNNFLFKFAFICTRFYMSRIYKNVFSTN
ncbi:Uncharacterised protein [Mycobacterium tuberculosis]|nr:Uncharacterised protein [Mycobacterium tuberculosis]